MSEISDDRFDAPSSEREVVEHLRSESKVIDIESAPRGKEARKPKDEYLERVQKRVRTEYLMEGLRTFNKLPLEEISQKCMAADDMADLSDAELDNDQLARRYWKYAMRVANRSRAEMGHEYRSAEHEEIEGDALLGLAMGINKFREAGRDSTKIIRGWIKIGIMRGLYNRGTKKVLRTVQLEADPVIVSKYTEGIEEIADDLTPADRDLVERKLEGQSTREIAEANEVSENAIIQRSHRLRTRVVARPTLMQKVHDCLLPVPELTI
ncbi:MAG: hypothetical protein NXI04_27650 [Planctomycetaceae bacterium]|nr:hypothetical protein [Planctomycetaceae bacterium]